MLIINPLLKPHNMKLPLGPGIPIPVPAIILAGWTYSSFPAGNNLLSDLFILNT